MYPIVIFVIAIVITIFLLWKVVPVFEEMYGGIGFETLYKPFHKNFFQQNQA